MSPPTNETVELLRSLQQRLTEEGHRVQGEMMGKVAERLASAEDINAALEQLYLVQGWDAIALRLMWYVEGGRAGGAEVPLEALREYQVDELHHLLMAGPGGDGSAATPPTEDSTSVPVTGTVFEALHQFNTSLEDLRRTAFEGERYQGMRQGFFDAALSQAGRLHQTCSAQGAEAPSQFAAAFSLFLRYVIERDLFDDARVAHLIDNAGQALQEVLGGPEENYTPLLQTIDMLHNPETLLE
ncbi:MAG: hypothetical protein AB1428_05130 [Bacteroidota bacterium]